MQSRVEFEYSKDKAEGLIMVKGNAWIGEPDKETALGPWVSDEYFNRRLALEDLIQVLLNEIVSGHLRYKLASNGGYFERAESNEQDRVLGQTLRQLHELMEENARLDERLQSALMGNTKMYEDNKDLREQLLLAREQVEEYEETKRLLAEAHAKIERQGGRLAQVRAITEKDT
jgi:hypothetical protein